MESDDLGHAPSSSKPFKVLYAWQEELAPEDEQHVSQPAAAAALPDAEATAKTEAEIQAWLVAQLSEMLQVTSQELSISEPFTRYGLDSANAVKAIGKLETWLRRPLSPTLIWDYPNVEVLARHLAGGVEAEPQPVTEDLSRIEREPLAIIGMGCRFPGAPSPEAFWRLLHEGLDAVSEVPPERWDVDAVYDPTPSTPGKTYTRTGAFLDQVDQFEPSFFGISGGEAASMDPQQRLVLEVTWEALESAGWAPERLAGTRTGVFIGISNLDYSLMQTTNTATISVYSGTGAAHCITANRLSYLLDFRGPSLIVDTACSSALVAVHLACQSLRTGESDVAVAGGVNLVLSPEPTIAYSQAQMLSAHGCCKTFDADADGYARGEGCGVVVLKRLSSALADGDPILALVRGSAVNQDGRTNGMTAPNGLSQQAVIRDALENAGVEPAQISYIEAHGTGTPLGDPIEAQALAAVLGREPAKYPCFVGSVKTNIGHLEPAAGIASMIKVVLAFQHGEIPPHLHLEKLNPLISLEDTRLVIPTERCSWPAEAQPRIAGVSAFGFGGTNAHVILEEAPVRPTVHSQVERPLHLFTLSARSAKALKESARRFADRVASLPADSLADVCYTANVGRSHFSHRLAVPVESLASLPERLNGFATEQEVPRLLSGQVRGKHKPAIAFLFTGQGSQYVGMGHQLYATQPTFRQALDRCAELLQPYLEQPLLSVLYPAEGQGSPLDETAYTQPALFAVEYALAELWRSWGLEPQAVMGHSIGEYVAGCEAGLFSLADGLKMVAARGRLMQGLSAAGAMAVVFASEARVAAAVEPYRAEVSIAALNGPNNVVISGAQAAVQAVRQNLEAEDIVTRPLVVSHAFHSPLMEPMLDDFEAIVRQVEFHAPRLPLVSNVTGQFLAEGQGTEARYWRQHIRSAVQFEASLQTLAAQGYRVFLEIGPNSVLSGMGKRCLPDGELKWLTSLQKGKADWETLLGSLGELYVQGAPIDWTGFDQDYARRRIPLPTYPFERQRYWIELAKGSRSSLGTGANPNASGRSLHPLLGYRLRSALKEIQFESEITPVATPYLNDHRVCGQTVFPAAAYLEMARAAVATVWPAHVNALENVGLNDLLILTDEPQVVQLILSPNGSDSGTFQILSQEKEGEVWRLHMTGSINNHPVVSSEPEQEVALSEAQARCQEELPGNLYYERLLKLGLEYGPGFRGIEKLWRGQGEALGLVRLPNELAAEAGAYAIHPAMLDACFQVPAVAFAGDRENEVYLPIGVESFRVLAKPGDSVWGYARLQSGDETHRDTPKADVYIFDQAGQLVAQLGGLSARRTTREALQRIGHDRVSDWLYTIQWHSQARTAGAVPAADHTLGPWLILADRGGVGAALATRLSECGSCTLVYTDGTGQPGAAEAALDPTRPEDFEEQLAKAAVPYRGIIHLWGLDTTGAEQITSDSLQNDQARMCGSVLHLVQALAKTKWATSPALYLITRGAQPVAQEAMSLGVTQASLAGLVRVIALEHPELRCVQVDLDHVSGSDEIENLVAEICSQPNENQIAFRQGVRYVPRLIHLPSSQAESKGKRSETQPLELEIPTRGVLDSLTLQHAIRRAPEPGEVEIQVYTTGLNFRDVLNALDLYPGTQRPLGMECAGRIVAVGAGVTRWRVGDEVVAFAIGSFRSFVTTRSDWVALKPEQLSFEEAATIPIPYMTAYYSLHHLAKIKAGDRVLIHAAAGGVGLAAVLLAQRAGAEVFATAGSQAKRDFLRSLGVQHLMDSRSLDFASQVMDCTGGRGVDIVLNSLSGEFIAKSLSVLATGGRFVEIGKIGIWDQTQVEQSTRDASYFVFDLGREARSNSAEIGEMLCALMEEFRQGILRPLPHRVFPIQEAISAFRTMALAKHTGRIVLTWQQRRMETYTGGFHADRTYLITGGRGGLGLQLAQWMVEHGARHLVLVGRSAPTEAVRRTVGELEQAGARIMFAQADVSQAEQVADVLTEIARSMPPLRGIVHAAGLLDDGVLARQNWERFARVLAPKVQGAWNLHTLTLSIPLDFFILFSSTAALLGSPGQGNYAAANAFLDGLAHYRRAQGLPSISINWGAWGEAGMAARDDANKWLTLMGIEMIAPPQGLQALEQILRQNPVQIAAMPVNWQKLLEQFPQNSEPPLLSEILEETRSRHKGQRSATTQIEILSRLEQTPPSNRRRVLVTLMGEQARKALGLDPSFELDIHQPLNELGLNSLMALELRNALNLSLGRPLPATVLFDHPTIEGLSNYLADEVLHLPVAENRPASHALAGPAVEEQDEIDTEIKELSSDELEALVAEELAAVKPLVGE